MWIEITNKRNLTTALQKAAKRDGVELEIIEADKPVEDEGSRKVNKGKADKKQPKKPKLPWKKRVRRICWVILLLCIVGMIFMGILNVIQAQDNKYLNSLQDTRLVPYETGIYEVRKIVALYNIHDAESYDYARNYLNLSDELEKRLFPTDTYRGDELPEAEVTLRDIRYEVTNEDYTRYLVYLTRKTDYGVKYFRAIVVLENKTIVDWINLD